MLNEGELLPAIQDLLKKRGQGEELVVFDHAKFKSYKEVATYLNTQVGGSQYAFRTRCQITLRDFAHHRMAVDSGPQGHAQHGITLSTTRVVRYTRSAVTRAALPKQGTPETPALRQIAL